MPLVVATDIIALNTISENLFSRGWILYADMKLHFSQKLTLSTAIFKETFSFLIKHPPLDPS